MTIGANKNVRSIVFAEDFDIQQFAVQSAGMNRRQMKDVVMQSWRTETPLDFAMVRTRKKEALDTEFGGLIDIKEPEFGFEEIGGHEHFKLYCQQNIIGPLKTNNRQMCSRGVVMSGPPGTGKTMIAWALAKEAGLNFISVDLGKVFGGLVGETEANVRKLVEAIEAASPCIAFFDEIDSVLSSGRSSGGDSGTSARVFNNFMTWMSDPGRRGKVVALMATNRPDLLDDALIRAGRIDAKIPMLAPAKGDAMGRWNILAALTKKHKIVLSKELQATRGSSTGLGLLLNDDTRILTGAEIEQIVEKSFRKAYYANRMKNDKLDATVQLVDFEAAMKALIPNTGAVERQTDLALLFLDDFDNCPVAWLDAARAIAADNDGTMVRLGLKREEAA
jgi:SpoVK/Ycf46/Vps4 family AAA+-type ATPase